VVCHRSGCANSAARTTVEVAQATQEVERQGHSGEKSERTHCADGSPLGKMR